MSDTLWNRRFEGRETVPLFESYNASIATDRFLADADVAASQAYARGLHRSGILTGEELASVLRGLEIVRERIRQGENLDRFEDIHTAVEFLLLDEIGEPAKKLHTGRSRNEQVVTDERLYLKKMILEIVELIADIQIALIQAAEEHDSVVMPGYTHLQRGQVILYAHYLMSFFWPLERGKARLRDALTRVDVLPLGSGALGGSTIALDREYLGRLLGFGNLSENSIDAVSDRSFILEVLGVLLLILLDLGRWAADCVLFASAEFHFLDFDDSLAASSSLMPQKKNPDILELVRAAPGRLFGCLSQLVLVVKGLPSAYNKDLQEDKEPLRIGVSTTLDALRVVALAIPRIRPRPESMARAVDDSLFATDLVDYLVEKGVPFREAHALTGEIVRVTGTPGRCLRTLSDDEYRSFHPVFGPDVKDLFDPQTSVRRKRTPGSTHPEQVREQIEQAKRIL
jgi:argininosuccinate lyase